MPFLSVVTSLTYVARVLVLASLCSPLMAADVIKLTGAGASFPSPLYQRWFRDYYLGHPNVRVDYQAIGSGAGVNNFIDGRLDFAGSDLPLTGEQAVKVKGGIVQLPMTAGAAVLAYHLPGIDNLSLSRAAVSGIFLGNVSRWNDPIISAANEGVKLPDLAITLVARADSSGTTYVMTRHLSAINEEFAKTVGVTMTPAWPEKLKERGALIRGQGNGGVAAYVKAVPGAIGYVQYAYAHLIDIQIASLQNQAGEFVSPVSDSFRAAVDSFKDEFDNPHVADPRGPGAYPILTVSWLIARKDFSDQKAEALKDVIRYCLTDGQKVADSLGYIPLTDKGIKLILQEVDPSE